MSKDDMKKAFLLQFGKQLQEVRQSKGLSYRKLAQQCDIDHSTISKIEKGKANITLETVVELLKGLNAQPKDLFGFNLELMEN